MITGCCSRVTGRDDAGGLPDRLPDGHPTFIPSRPAHFPGIP